MCWVLEDGGDDMDERGVVQEAVDGVGSDTWAGSTCMGDGDRGFICYNPLTNFSFLPSSGPPSIQPAVLPPQPISTAPAPAPPAQSTSSSQHAPLAFNPFHTSYAPLYHVTDFYEHPQGYAQL